MAIASRGSSSNLYSDSGSRVHDWVDGGRMEEFMESEGEADSSGEGRAKGRS